MNEGYTLDVIVAGEPHPMVVQTAYRNGDPETYRDLMERALQETDHTQRPFEDWELRNEAGVEILRLEQPADTLAKRGWPRLWLQLRAGGGS